MSFEAMNWAAQVQAPLSTNEQFVLEVLANMANEQFECYPSMSHVARRTRLHRATVDRAITTLVRFGLVAKTSRGRGKGSSNLYRLLVDKPPRYPVELRADQPERPLRALDDTPDLVALCDNPLSTMSHGATTPLSHGATHSDETLSQGATTLVASGATTLVASGATRITRNHQESPDADPEARFALDEGTKALGMARLAEMRARIGQAQGCSGGAR
jgi:hypothetical protein